MKPEIRKIVTFVEDTRSEAGRDVDHPVRRAVAAAVIRNPYAGSYVQDLSPLYAMSEILSEMLSIRAIAALGIPGEKVESFGKAAAIGEDGELEHGAALMHPSLGAPMRRLLGKGTALIPSSKKRCGPGAPFDLPLGHKDAAKVRSHFDGIEVRIPDAPRADEIVLAIGFSIGGRPLARVGGLTVEQVKGEDGLV